MTYKILKGNSLDLLPTLADNSIDAIVTDPPYELGFMGKTWDNSGIAYSLELWQQCLRVLKPGGHLLAFSGSRTYHRMVVAIEDAGFEIRDMISWISNKTFPKSQNIAKAIDKQAGARGHVAKGFLVAGEYNNRQLQGPDTTYQDPALVTPEAKKWDGWGTGLKPTVEPIVMARKPVEVTVANNVLTYGTGGLNIDASRIGTEERVNPPGNNQDGSGWGMRPRIEPNKVQGRWPANLILDEYTAELLDEQSDQASRFFYVAKASKRDRNEGLDDANAHPTVKPTELMQYLVKLVTPPNGTVLDPFTGSGSTGKAAILEGFDFIGIELTEDYWPIIEGRLKHAEAKVAEAKENIVAQPQGLF
jgi:DNA modification methylase